MLAIDNRKFVQAHRAFLSHMKKKGDGVAFTNFGHRFLVSDEIAYKAEAVCLGRKKLCFDKWVVWQAKTGRIVDALREACRPAVSKNLLEHKYGDEKNSHQALYRLKTTKEVRLFESHICSLRTHIDGDDDTVGKSFDEFVTFLKEHHLGCRWEFISYLVFLMRPERFFPIRSSRFQRLLTFYGIECKIAKQVSWENYKLILDVADLVKERLLTYGSPTAIELQSYMWVVQYLIPKLNGDEVAAEIDFDEELRKRLEKELGKQRIDRYSGRAICL